MADIMVTLQRLANENTAKTFKFNREEAKTTRDWETQMSNTAHQREVKDLIAAGLNPVLSSGGSGASTPTTSSASGVADSAVNAIGNVQSSRNSAAAMRYSARMNLQAAQAAAAAQRYAADQAYNASVYSSDKSYAARVETSVAGTANRFLNNITGGDWSKTVANALNKRIANANAFHDNQIYKMTNSGILKNLGPGGRDVINKFLGSHGYLMTPINTAFFAKFIFTGDFKYFKMLHRNINSAKGLKTDNYH